jgi:hypothetical protein
MANLEIKIGAKDSASGVLNKLKGSLGSFSSGFGSIWGKIAGAITAGAVLAKAKSTAAALDDLKDRSENLRMPTDELQRWEYAANDAGLGSEKFGNALNKLNGLIQDSGKGGAAGLAAIEKLAAINIDPNQLKGKSFSDQLGMVFDGLAKVGKESDALAAASDIFGEKMGKNVLGLAANWRTLKAEVSGEKIFTQEDIAAGENFTKTIAQLDITIQKLVANSGLIQWLTRIGAAMDKIYSATPSKADYGTAGAAVSDRDIAISALSKDKKYTKRENVGSFFLPNYQNVTNIPEKDIADYMAKNMPDSGAKEKARIELEAANKNLKAQKEAAAVAQAQSKANEDNFNTTIKRLEANADVQKLGKITGQSGLTPGDREALYNASSISERFKIEQQITEEKKKQVESATEQKKIDDGIADAHKSILEQIAALDEKRKTQDLINAGLEKEAFIREQISQAQKAAKDKGTSATAAELSAITANAAALYESQHMNAFKGAQGAIVNDRFSAVGGMGGKMFSQDSTPRQHLEVAKQTQKAVADIRQYAATIAGKDNGALRAP